MKTIVEQVTDLTRKIVVETKKTIEKEKYNVLYVSTDTISFIDDKKNAFSVTIDIKRAKKEELIDDIDDLDNGYYPGTTPSFFF